MNRHRSTVVAFFLLIASPLFPRAQETHLSPQARKLTDAWAELQRKPNAPMVQERYLNSFPHTYKSFQYLFEPGRELYDGSDYIDVLPSLAIHHETEVGDLLVQLSKDAHYEADAPSYLQQATATYASKYTKTFVELLNQLSPRERTHLITFLADVENFSAYKQYQEIVDHLKRLGEGGLAMKFELAREKRSQQQHH